MTISHQLPRWLRCLRHADTFRDSRLHADCWVRYATDQEIEEVSQLVEQRAVDPSSGMKVSEARVFFEKVLELIGPATRVESLSVKWSPITPLTSAHQPDQEG